MSIPGSQFFHWLQWRGWAVTQANPEWLFLGCWRNPCCFARELAKEEDGMVKHGRNVAQLNCCFTQRNMGWESNFLAKERPGYLVLHWGTFEWPLHCGIGNCREFPFHLVWHRSAHSHHQIDQAKQPLGCPCSEGNFALSKRPELLRETLAHVFLTFKNHLQQIWFLSSRRTRGKSRSSFQNGQAALGWGRPPKFGLQMKRKPSSPDWSWGALQLWCSNWFWLKAPKTPVFQAKLCFWKISFVHFVSIRKSICIGKTVIHKEKRVIQLPQSHVNLNNNAIIIPLARLFQSRRKTLEKSISEAGLLDRKFCAQLGKQENTFCRLATTHDREFWSHTKPKQLFIVSTHLRWTTAESWQSEIAMMIRLFDVRIRFRNQDYTTSHHGSRKWNELNKFQFSLLKQSSYSKEIQKDNLWHYIIFNASVFSLSLCLLSLSFVYSCLARACALVFFHVIRPSRPQSAKSEVEVRFHIPQIQSSSQTPKNGGLQSSHQSDLAILDFRLFQERIGMAIVKIG